MAFDETLAERVRDALAPHADLTERKMFGGIAFMIGGNMAVGVIEDDLMVRVDPADAEQALIEPHTRPDGLHRPPDERHAFRRLRGHRLRREPCRLGGGRR